jgi:hypothetical protein
MGVINQQTWGYSPSMMGVLQTKNPAISNQDCDITKTHVDSSLLWMSATHSSIE